MMRISLILFCSFLLAACGSPAANTAKNMASSNAAASPSVVPEFQPKAEAVTFDAPDGVKLVGSFYKAQKVNSPAVLLMHQWEANRHTFDEFAERINKAGYAVLSLDGRGFGDSTKTADGKSVKAGRTDADVKAMLGDVNSAVEFLGKQENVDANKIGIVGASYGSSLAILYAADHPNIAAVVLLSPGLNYFGNMPTEPAVKKYGSRPILLVAAEDDKESADAVRQLKEVSANPKAEATVYADGGHGTAIFAYRDPDDSAARPLADLMHKFLAKAFKTEAAK
ncbi:MAG: alpha/beta fold hydrolase [Chloracidobacterium sp.]|nr:alpha/beta fold hydrolase [Chloracidobacterium sp.]MCO5333964.1 alpha/beta fold hydrolase [Pyrinomonadaceae bacterium]